MHLLTVMVSIAVDYVSHGNTTSSAKSNHPSATQTIVPANANHSTRRHAMRSAGKSKQVECDGHSTNPHWTQSTPAMLTITVRRCVWSTNDECGHYWLDIYWYAVLMRINKPEIRIGGSVWCLIYVDHAIFVWQSCRAEASRLEVTLWCRTMSNGDRGSACHIPHVSIYLPITSHVFWLNGLH